ncbi:MAG TPA: glutamate-cysteine ligase family protein [Paucimonas sp.]|nr:glutamate-cysteine ligase family protein [Paucimonas sp.]
MSSPVLDAFMGYGIEIEYAIVADADLSCLPIADRLLAKAAGGKKSSEVQRGMLGWSNEFVMHVVEVKNLRPSASLSYLCGLLQNEVRAINQMLLEWHARLMPAAMHPWMDPSRETQLWPDDPHGIYRTYARIFDVKTHGWANLQSMHVNLPFANDEQFARLHAAIRLLLPIIPALAASSPIADGRATGYADYRMAAYRDNAAAFPEIAGRIVPETVLNRLEYEETILAPMYRAIAPRDRDRVLQHEWLNSRGAIARFDRHAIEIRVTDTQECPQADLAIAAAIAATAHMLYENETAPIAVQQSFATERLAALLTACIRDADLAPIDDAEYLAAFGYPGKHCRARDLWRHLVRRMGQSELIHAQSWRAQLEIMLEHGPLARRIEKALGGVHGEIPHERLAAVYHRLCECLDEGAMFVPAAAAESG